MAVAQHRFHWPTISPLWQLADSQDPLCAELADGHYSRQTPGSKRFLACGRNIVLHHYGERGTATWGVLLNLDNAGALRWRNAIFRNTSRTLSSALVEGATLATYDEWTKRYGALPDLPLTTEIDIDATAARRSKHKEPGACYREVGWIETHRRLDRKPHLVYLKAPDATTKGAR